MSNQKIDDVGAKYIPSLEDIEACKRVIRWHGIKRDKNKGGFHPPNEAVPVDRLPEDFEGEYNI